jgi:hypothetical protein
VTLFDVLPSSAAPGVVVIDVISVSVFPLDFFEPEGLDVWPDFGGPFTTVLTERDLLLLVATRGSSSESESAATAFFGATPRLQFTVLAIFFAFPPFSVSESELLVSHIWFCPCLCGCLCVCVCVLNCVCVCVRKKLTLLNLDTF